MAAGSSSRATSSNRLPLVSVPLGAVVRDQVVNKAVVREDPLARETERLICD